MEDSGKADIENRAGKDIDKGVKPDIVVENLAAEDPAAEKKQRLIKQVKTAFSLFFFWSIFFLFLSFFESDICGYSKYSILVLSAISIKRDNLSSKYPNAKI